jgi:hypothetical protein
MLMDYDESRLGFYLDYLSFVILAVFLVRLAAALGRRKAGPGAGGGEADMETDG